MLYVWQLQICTLARILKLQLVSISEYHLTSLKSISTGWWNLQKKENWTSTVQSKLSLIVFRSSQDQCKTF